MKTHIRAITEFTNGGIEVPVCDRSLGNKRYEFASKETATCKKCRRLYPKLYPWTNTGNKPASLEERLKSAKVVTMRQSELSSECWMVQMMGLSACESCEYKNSKECGGKNIRETGKNELGVDIPKVRA